MSFNSNKLHILIQNKVRIAFYIFFSMIICIWGVSQYYILKTEIAKESIKIEEWLNNNKQKIEQAIFLQNAISISDIEERLKNVLGHSLGTEILISDQNGGVVYENAPNIQTVSDEERVQIFMPPKYIINQSLEFATRPIGKIYLKANIGYDGLLIQSLLLFIVFIFSIFILRYTLNSIKNLLFNEIIEPVSLLEEHFIENKKSDHLIPFNYSLKIQNKEILDLISEYNRLVYKLNEAFENIKMTTEFAAKSELAMQVAHDIRSPIMAINAVASKLDMEDSKKKQILLEATQRINDIANLLLKKFKSDGDSSYQNLTRKVQDEISAKIQMHRVNVASILESVLDEKKVIHEMGLELTTSISQINRVENILISDIELKRIFSNIINNSIEAFDISKGKISIVGIDEGDFLRINIQDSGKGMSEEVRLKALEKGFSYGKQMGTGLGLNHARLELERVGGSIEIFSKPNKGTLVILKIPKLNPSFSLMSHPDSATVYN